MLRRILTFLLCLLPLAAASAETIAIIGTGDVAGALGPAFAEQGHRIVYGSRNPHRESVRELVARSGAYCTKSAVQSIGENACAGTALARGSPSAEATHAVLCIALGSTWPSSTPRRTTGETPLLYREPLGTTRERDETHSTRDRG